MRGQAGSGWVLTNVQEGVERGVGEHVMGCAELRIWLAEQRQMQVLADASPADM